MGRLARLTAEAKTVDRNHRLASGLEGGLRVAVPPPSSLLQKVWSIPGVGKVTVIRPSRARLQKLSRRWSEKRKPGDLATGWKWEDVWADPEVFLLRGPNDEELALWRSSKGAINLAGESFYRLDNIEVNPDERGGVVGRFLMTLIGSRANELGSGVILACPEGLVPWYEDQGADDGTGLGWKYPKELRVLRFDADAVNNLKEFADALEDKK